MVLTIPGFTDMFSRDRRNIREDISVVQKKFQSVVVSLEKDGDTDNIQDAIKMVSRGGTIFIKKGVYSTDKPVVMKSNIVMEGEGDNSELQMSYDGDWNDPTMDFDNVSNVTIKNLKLNFTLNNAASAHDTYIGLGDAVGAQNIIFDNVYFVKTNDGGAHTNLIGTGGGNGEALTNIKIKNCRAANGTNGDVTEFFDHGSLVTKLEISFNDVSTLKLLGESDGTDYDNALILFNRCGTIRLPGGNENFIVGNMNRGIELEAAFSDCSNNIIMNNLCTLAGSTIAIGVNCDANIVVGNQVQNAITDGGAGNVIQHNLSF